MGAAPAGGGAAPSAPAAPQAAPQAPAETKPAETAGAPATEGGAPATSQPRDAAGRFVKVSWRVDGRDHEREVPEEEAVRLAGMTYGLQGTLQKRAEQVRAMEERLAQWTPPEGVDEADFMAERLEALLKQRGIKPGDGTKMTPEQQELEKARAELAAMKQHEEKRQRAEQEAQLQRQAKEQVDAIAKDYLPALKTAGLPAVPMLLPLVVEHVQSAYDALGEAPPALVARGVAEEVDKLVAPVLEGLGPEGLLKRYPGVLQKLETMDGETLLATFPGLGKAVQAALLARFKKGPAAPASAATNRPPAAKPASSPYGSPTEIAAAYARAHKGG